jgi:hypothetical protein
LSSAQASDAPLTAALSSDGHDVRPSLVESFGWSQGSDSNTMALLKKVRAW